MMMNEGFVMLRNDLLDDNYSFEMKKPKTAITNILWLLLFLFLLTINILFFILVKINSEFDFDDIEYHNIIISNAIYIAIPIIYFFIKFKMTSMFCCDKKNAAMKLLDNGLPVCFCREALKSCQNIIIYFVPAVSTFIVVCLLSLSKELEGTYFILVVIMSFFISFDLICAIYIQYIKVRFKPDYISVNKHVFNLTLYRKQKITKL